MPMILSWSKSSVAQDPRTNTAWGDNPLLQMRALTHQRISLGRNVTRYLLRTILFPPAIRSSLVHITGLEWNQWSTRPHLDLCFIMEASGSSVCILRKETLAHVSILTMRLDTSMPFICSFFPGTLIKSLLYFMLPEWLSSLVLQDP